MKIASSPGAGPKSALPTDDASGSIPPGDGDVAGPAQGGELRSNLGLPGDLVSALEVVRSRLTNEKAIVQIQSAVMTNGHDTAMAIIENI